MKTTKAQALTQLRVAAMLVAQAESGRVADHIDQFRTANKELALAQLAAIAAGARPTEVVDASEWDGPRW